MLSTLRPHLLLAAILAALVAAVRAKAAFRLTLYLAVEFVTTAVLEGFCLRVDWRTSRAYVIAYAIARPVDLAAALNLSRFKISAALVVVSWSWLAWQFVTPSTNSVIVFSEGAVFLLAGLSLALCVPFEPNPLVYGPIAALWCSLALFDYGYAMGWKLIAWEKLNEYWPATICEVCFGWLALYLWAVPREV
jgi:hypothetical protein